MKRSSQPLTLSLLKSLRRTFVATGLSIVSTHASSLQAAETPKLVPSSLIQIPFSSNFYSPYAFVVDKEARELTVWEQTSTGLKQVASFPADLGKNTGAKRSRGDYKTPEGIYFLLERMEGPSLNFNLYGKRAFTTNYPNLFDRLDGKTGDGIWLHAVPDQVPLTRGSRGCVVVRNDVILKISQYIKLGRTPILIQNRMETVAEKTMAEQTAAVSKWLESWRTAWETRDIDAYIRHYDEAFRSTGMNRDEWRAYKERLAKAAKTIQVRFSKPAIFGDRDRVILRFIQDYTSDRYNDIGEKVLYVKKTADGEYRIVGEVWTAETSGLAREELGLNGTTTALNCENEGDGPSCTQASTAR